MTEYSAFGQLTIGQYLPYGSLVHRLDPRAKLVMFTLLVCAVTGLVVVAMLRQGVPPAWAAAGASRTKPGTASTQRKAASSIAACAKALTRRR